MAEFIAHDGSSQSKSTPCDDPSRTDNVSKFSELFTGDSLLELCNSFWMRSPSARKDVQPYLRGCKWSPDGTCCLCVVNNDGFHIMELPRDLYEECPSRDRMITLLPAVIHVKESGTVYDFCWYPKMNSHYPETCSWISTKINSPIQMWDAYNGSLRCSYRGFNAVDEMEPAISVTFINEGQRIVGGYKNCLRTFDVERPGRDFLEHKIKSPASCFATHGNLLAVGSWNANIQMFSIIDNGTYRSVGNFHAHTGGITHLKFTPDGTKLVSGGRKDNNLCVWDVRYHRRPLNILKRCVSTNQRIYFDISPCGRYLVSGGTDGVLRVWDDKVTKWTEQFNVNHGNQENATFRFPLYSDCCNSISIHPSRPILATGSGQFHFVDPVKQLESESDSGINCDVVTVEPQSAAYVDSSDEERSVESDDVPLTQVPKTDITNKIGFQEHENTSSEVHAIDSIKEFTNTALDVDAEMAPVKINVLETDSESPPHKKLKWSNDISTADKKINNNGTIVIIPAIKNYNLEQVYEEPPTKKVKPNVDETPENNIDNELEIDTVDNATSNVINEAVIMPSKQITLITSPLNSIRIYEQCSASENIGKVNIDLQSSIKLSKIEETQTVLVKDPDLTRHEEPHSIPKQSGFIESNSSDEPLRSLNTDTIFSEKVIESNNCDISSTKITDNLAVRKPSDRKCIVDSALESDDDNDINENKMKYSSYAENNLTFWWIANT